VASQEIAESAVGCAIKLDAFGIHSGAEQRHIVFPADDCAEFAEWCRKYGQSRSSRSPDEAFRSGRHDLAVLAEEMPSGAKKEDGAIEMPASRSMTPTTR